MADIDGKIAGSGKLREDRDDGEGGEDGEVVAGNRGGWAAGALLAVG